MSASRGLYFNEFGLPWHGDVATVFKSQFTPTNQKLNELRESLSAIADRTLETVQHIGKNPEAFTYQRTPHDSGYIYRLHFYGDLKVVAALSVRCRGALDFLTSGCDGRSTAASRAE